MKTLIALLLTTTVAVAQPPLDFMSPIMPEFRMPTTIPWTENGNVLGTATTTDGSVVYLRDKKGVHIATVVIRNGHRIILDPNGKPFGAKE